MRRREREVLKRIICFVLIVSLVSQNGMDTVLAKQDKGNKSNKQTERTVSEGDVSLGDVSASDLEPEILSELTDRRSLYSKEYLLSDNSRTVVVYNGQIHYENADGTLSEIDNSILETEGGYQNGANSYEVVFTDNEDSQGQVIYKEDGYEISWQMVELTEGSTDGEDASGSGDECETPEESGEENPEEEQPGDDQTQPGTTDGADAIDGEDVTGGDATEEDAADSDATDGEDITQSNATADSNQTISAKKDKSNGGNNGNGNNNGNNQNNSNNKNKTKKIQKPKVTGKVKDKTNNGNKSAKGKGFQDGEVFQPKQSAITYEGYAEGVTVEYEPAGDGIKENIILPTPDSGNEYIFSIQAKGLTASINDQNEVTFTDVHTGEIKYYFPAPFMIDSAGEVSYDAVYELVDMAEVEAEEDAEAADTIYLKIVLDEAWLDSAAYPVTVDPVLKQKKGGNILDSGCIRSDGGTSSIFYAGMSSTSVEYESYFRFAIPEMKPQCIVTEALLSLGGDTIEEDSAYVQAHMVGREWYMDDAQKGSQPEENKLTKGWDERPAKGDLIDYTQQGRYFNITKAVRKWQSGEAENYGIVISGYKAKKNTRREVPLRSSYLQITYRTATGLESYWGTHTTAAGTAGAGYINDYTGALTVVNTDVVTPGNRMPMSIQHVYQSNALDENSKWRLNYQETIKIPIDSADTVTYPYVYTDSDGTEHYFKKKEVTYRLNGTEKTVDTSGELKPAQDEDGLKLYIVPVSNEELKGQYPLKLVDKSASVVKYFDTFGRLAMIMDSNQHEKGSNSDTKERNCVIINYESAGEPLSFQTFDDTMDEALEFQTVCASGVDSKDAGYLAARGEMEDDLEKLKRDPYVQADYATAKHVRTAADALDTLMNDTTGPYKAEMKTQAAAIVAALEKAKTQARKLADVSNKRIASIKDAMADQNPTLHTAYFDYDEQGRLSSITDPTYEGDKAVQYFYDEKGDLIKIQYPDDKCAYYTYESGYMTSMQDTDGYKVTYGYGDANRIIKVEESHETGKGESKKVIKGQEYSITYNADNSTTFRFSGVDDVWDNDDDIENVHVFDNEGRSICVYSQSVTGQKILGATAATYQENGSDSGSRNKIKDCAVVGMHTNNLLVNHSFEYSDSKWSTYKTGSSAPESGALNASYVGVKYIGGRSAYANMAKRTGGTAGFSQQVSLAEGTYTFSAYVSAASISNTAAYLKVQTDEGVFTSNKITKATDAEFDNGWQRLSVSFSVDNTDASGKQTVTVYLETDCGTAKGAGKVYFDCAQLETGSVANDYNILEDGSFELTTDAAPYKWTKPTISVETADTTPLGGVDGGKYYQITGQPGKNKYLRFTTNLGNSKNSYVLSGWVKSESTPTRDGRDFLVKAYHSETDNCGVETIYQVSSDIDSYSEGWKYFCLILPAKAWKSTQFTICFYKNIGTLSIDGLQLTKNDVQSRKYDSEGSLTSSYTALKTDSYTYDTYKRTKKHTTAAGAYYINTYENNNELTKVAASIGPDTYYEYDKYGNQTSTRAYDPDSTANVELTSLTAYTEDGAFPAYSVDNAGNTTVYEYNERTGQIEGTRLPSKETGLKVDFGDDAVIMGDSAETAVYNPIKIEIGEDSLTEDAVTVDYLYDTRDRLIGVSQGLASEEGAANNSRRSVTYTYGEFDDLTAIHHNGFSYGFTYDEFGNVLTTSIAGQVISTNVYGANNGQLKQTIRADGTVLENSYDLYGRITESKVGGQVTNSYTFDNDGNLAKHFDQVGNQTNTYDYNDSNKVVRSEVYSGNSTATKDMESRMQYTYTKSGLVGTLSYEEQGDEVKTYKYTYAADELPTKSTHPDSSVTAWTYDSLRRNSKTVFTPKEGAADAKKLYTTLTYANGHAPIESGRTDTTTLVDTYTNKFGSSGSAVSEFTYNYDGWGNITKITDVAGKTRTYSYNDFSEVTEAVETYGNGSTSTYQYSYDAGGNILTETVNGKVNSYVYDSVWKDKLISYNGKAITYDEAGHPLNYMGSTMTWDVNDRLTSISGKTANGTASNISYTYLSDGSRRSKTVDGVTTTYHYNNGLLLSQSTGDETLHFYYDSTGKVVSLGYQKGSAAEVGYFFARNAQGDIIAVYRSSDSKLVGTYEYDLWGKPVSATEASAGIDTNDILTKNPFRYRGYYFDEETGFYYLNARYYDSGVRRFISVDDISYLGADETVTGFNLFVYCGNNPVKGYDPTGHWDWGGVITGLGISVAAVAIGIKGAAKSKEGLEVVAGFFMQGAVMTYAAATDSVMVMDLSFSKGLVDKYGKGGASIVVDYQNDESNLYFHLGGGRGSSEGFSGAVGLVDNYSEPEDYAGWFVDYNAGYYIGVDYCRNPDMMLSEPTQAGLITFGDGFNLGFGADYFFEPIGLLTW